jgi:hypothetical protein
MDPLKRNDIRTQISIQKGRRGLVVVAELATLQVGGHFRSPEGRGWGGDGGGT